MAVFRRVVLGVLCACMLCVGAFALDDETPSDVPFYGACYVTGDSDELGSVTLYFPYSYRNGYLGVDSDGYLFNVSNTSITCYLEGYNYCNIPAWSYPRYREDSGYTYTDLYILPTASNANVAEEVPSLYTISDLLPYGTLLMLGVIFLCCMKRS